MNKYSKNSVALCCVMAATSGLLMGWGPAAYSVIGSTPTANTRVCVGRNTRSLLMARASFEENNCAPVIQADEIPSIVGGGPAFFQRNTMAAVNGTSVTDLIGGAAAPDDIRCLSDMELAAMGGVFDPWNGLSLTGIPEDAGRRRGVCGAHSYCDVTINSGMCVPLNRPLGSPGVLDFNPSAPNVGNWGSLCGSASGVDTAACGQGNYCVARGTLPFADWAPLQDVARAQELRGLTQAYFTAAEQAALPGECHPTVRPGDICDGEWPDVMGDGTFSGAATVHTVALACHPGLVCDRSFAGPSGQGTCRLDSDGPLVGCTSDAECDPATQFCQMDVASDSAVPGVCVRRQGNESFCDRDEECSSGLTCVLESSDADAQSVCCPSGPSVACDEATPCCGQQLCVGSTTGGPFDPAIDDVGTCSECVRAGREPATGEQCCAGLVSRIDYNNPSGPTQCLPPCRDDGATETSPGFYDFACGGVGVVRPHVCDRRGALVPIVAVAEVCGDVDGDGNMDDDCDGLVDEANDTNGDGAIQPDERAGSSCGPATYGGTPVAATCAVSFSLNTQTRRCNANNFQCAIPEYTCKVDTDSMGGFTLEIIDPAGATLAQGSNPWPATSGPFPPDWFTFGGNAIDYCLQPGVDDLCTDACAGSTGGGLLRNNEGSFVCEDAPGICDLRINTNDQCFAPRVYK